MEQKFGQAQQGETNISSVVQIERPTPHQWQDYRDLKLRSLDQESIAFLDVEDGRARWEARSEEEWRKMLSGPNEDGSDTLVVMAHNGATPIGMVQALIPPTDNPHRIALIQHMWVDVENYRGKGYGRQLLMDLLRRLRERGDLDGAELSVVTTQKAAQNLYRSVGFEAFKLTTDSAHRGDETYDELEMRLDFSKFE